MPSIANFSASIQRHLVAAVDSITTVTANDVRLSYVVSEESGTEALNHHHPRIESLVASSAEDDLRGFGDVATFDIFNDDDSDLFGSPLAFDASEHGLWNGRFVPPPPRPPFFVDEAVLSDGLTTCDLCSWAMPTKSTFIFEGTIEKATELGWPLTLIIVSVLSALLGAIVMIAVVRCRRKKSSNNRNDTHVQWWSRNKRPHGPHGLGPGGTQGPQGPTAHNNNNNNNNHLRRSNIYTAHPADNIRGLQAPPPPLPPLSASSSLTAMSAIIGGGGAGGGATAPPLLSSPPMTPTDGQPQYFHPYQHHHHHHLHQHQHHHHLHPHQHPHGLYDDDDAYEEPEYHQPQELQLQLHQRHHSSSSLSSLTSSPSLMRHQQLMLPTPPTPPPPPSAVAAAAAAATQATITTTLPSTTETRHWPQATTMVVAS